MKITQNTTLSIGVFIALLAVIAAIFTLCIPVYDNLVFQNDLKASETKSILHFQSICERLERFEKRLDKRFDRIEHKLDNL